MSDDANELRHDLYVVTHDVRNLLASVRYSMEHAMTAKTEEHRNMYISRSIQGVETALQIAGRTLYSNNGDIDMLRRAINHSGPGAITLDGIIHNSLQAVASHAYDLKFFRQLACNYWSDDQELFIKARQEFGESTTDQKLLEHIQKYLFDISIEGDGLGLKIGDNESVASRLAVLFNELLLNAVKYTSTLERGKRFVRVNISYSHGSLAVKIQNSAEEGQRICSNRLGLGSAERLVKALNGEFDSAFENKIYTSSIKFCF